MKSIKAFSKALLLCGGIAALSSAAQAETISQNAGVTIVRGVDDADSAAQRQSSRGRSGIVVFRGQGTAAQPNGTTTAQPAPAARSQQIVGGQNLWVHDAADDTVTACSLRYDYYGNQRVRCRDSQR